MLNISDDRVGRQLTSPGNSSDLGLTTVSDGVAVCLIAPSFEVGTRILAQVLRHVQQGLFTAQSSLEP